MMRNKTVLLSTMLCLLPMILSLVVYEQLPNQVAVHFDYSGTPDTYMPKLIAAFGLPILLALLNLYVQFRVEKDPKGERAPSMLRTLSKWSVPIISMIAIPITLFMALGKNIPIVMIISAIVGIVVVVSGNYLPKCKQNNTIGIKLPWTLEDDETWNHTHRFAGFIWVIGGSVIVINAFLQIHYVIFAVIVCLVVLPFVYAYVFYSRKR